MLVQIAKSSNRAAHNAPPEGKPGVQDPETLPLISNHVFCENKGLILSSMPLVEKFGCKQVNFKLIPFFISMPENAFYPNCRVHLQD